LEGEAPRVILIKSCLAIPVYLLSFFKFPKWAFDLINSQMANCLWNDFERHRKLHLANWKLICKRMKFRGLGIPDLANVNPCLLSSWIKRYSMDEVKLWRTMVILDITPGIQTFYVVIVLGLSVPLSLNIGGKLGMEILSDFGRIDGADPLH
jgi:hypothetical protein